MNDTRMDTAARTLDDTAQWLTNVRGAAADLTVRP